MNNWETAEIIEKSNVDMTSLKTKLTSMSLTICSKDENKTGIHVLLNMYKRFWQPECDKYVLNFLNCMTSTQSYRKKSIWAKHSLFYTELQHNPLEVDPFDNFWCNHNHVQNLLRDTCLYCIPLFEMLIGVTENLRCKSENLLQYSLCHGFP